MIKSMCFTGHRSIAKKKLPFFLVHLQNLLENAVQKGFLDFYSGGAIGWDTYCAQTVLDLRDDYPDITLNLILPCSTNDQTAHWTKEQKIAYDCIYTKADSHEFIALDYTSDCMRQRNARLVELADCLVCYCYPSMARSGSAQTIRFAQKKGIPIINLALLADDDNTPELPF